MCIFSVEDYNVPGTPLVLNGSVVMLEPSSSTSSKQMPSTGAIPKSISFDKTAERGDKVVIFYFFFFCKYSITDDFSLISV